MMRRFFLLVSLLLFFGQANAATVDVPAPLRFLVSGEWFDGPATACAAWGRGFNPPKVYQGFEPYGSNAIVCQFNGSAQVLGGEFYCPDSKSTMVTVDGVKMCRFQKLDCPPGEVDVDGKCLPECKGQQTRGADNQCKCDAASYNARAKGLTWIEGVGEQPTGATCWNECMFQTGFGLGGGGKWTAELGPMTGAMCSGGSKSPEKPPIPTKKPPCAPSEGVMTTSTGSVACVPEGTPDMRRPEYKKEKKVETFPDGSKKETETTKTTDPATGTSTSSGTTTTYPTPSGNPGQAGPTGTSTSDVSTGKTASGSGNGNTSGAGNGGKGSGGDGGGCESSFCPPGDLYKKKEEKFEGPLSRFADGVKSSVIGTDSAKFFTVTIPTAGCPDWSAQIPYFNKRVSVSEYMCIPAAINAMDVAGAVLMILAAFAAFKWAML